MVGGYTKNLKNSLKYISTQSLYTLVNLGLTLLTKRYRLANFYAYLRAAITGLFILELPDKIYFMHAIHNIHVRIALIDILSYKSMHYLTIK